jgi:hypothetical protein
MNQSSNPLKKNHAAWAIFSILNNTKLQSKPVMGWRLIGDKKVTVELNLHIIRKFRNELVFKAEGENQIVLSHLVAGSDKLNIFLPNDLALFQSKIKVFENGLVTLSMPEMIAQVDRRKFMRLPVDDGIDCSIKFFKQSHLQQRNIQSFDRKCFDVSAGGLSFIVSKAEEKFFKSGDFILGLELKIDGIVNTMSAQVVNILDIEPNERNKLIYKGSKICLRFTQIDQKAQKFIQDFVFKNSDLNSDVI